MDRTREFARRGAFIAALAGFAIILLAGCGSSSGGGGGSSSSASPSGDQPIYRLGTAGYGYDSLNPFVGMYAMDYAAWMLMYPNLVQYSSDLAGAARLRRVVDGERGRPHLDLQAALRRGLDRRPADHGQGRGLHHQHGGEVRRRGGRRAEPVRPRHQERDGRRRHDARRDARPALGGPDRQPLPAADPARARLVPVREGRRRQAQDGEHGPGRRARGLLRPVRDPEARPQGHDDLQARRHLLRPEAADHGVRLPGVHQRRRRRAGAQDRPGRLRRLPAAGVGAHDQERREPPDRGLRRRHPLVHRGELLQEQHQAPRAQQGRGAAGARPRHRPYRRHRLRVRRLSPTPAGRGCSTSTCHSSSRRRCR